MSSLKEAREMLSLAWSHHFISEEEFLLLYDASISKNPSFPHANYERFDLFDKTLLRFHCQSAACSSKSCCFICKPENYSLGETASSIV